MVTLNKKMRTIREQINKKTAEAKAFLTAENKDVEKATALLDEADELEKEYKAEKRLFEMEQNDAEKQSGKELEKKQKADTTKQFANVIRGLVRKDGTVTPMTEGVNADGGYTVPEDISTDIRRFKQNEFSFEKYIDVEQVTTHTGARTYETKATSTPFTDVAEAGESSESDKPHFMRITYSVTERAGFIPLTKSLMEDSSANIRALIVDWFRRKRIATINSKTLYTLTNGVTPTAVTTLNGLKKLITVDVGSDYDSKIYTNDDGVNWLDTLEDSNHRPLLNPVPSDPKKLQLSVGSKVIEVVQVPNRVWASAEGSNSSTVIPFIIGELSEAVKMFDRKNLEIAVSDVAAVTGFNAFAQNGVLLKGVVRDDYKKKDADAYKYATVTVSAS